MLQKSVVLKSVWITSLRFPWDISIHIISSAPKQTVPFPNDPPMTSCGMRSNPFLDSMKSLREWPSILKRKKSTLSADAFVFTTIIEFTPMLVTTLYFESSSHSRACENMKRRNYSFRAVSDWIFFECQPLKPIKPATRPRRLFNEEKGPQTCMNIGFLSTSIPYQWGKTVTKTAILRSIDP